MRSNDPNVAIVELIARALSDLDEQFVLVGGCAAGLLISDAALGAVRATDDVDLIVELIGPSARYTLDAKLRSAGFKNDPEVICRWQHQGVKVDIMPTTDDGYGFTNPWYPEAIRTADVLRLPSGNVFRVISAPLLIATKIVAFQDRGQGDFQSSHDLEDIVAVVDGRPELIAEFHKASEEVREFLDDEIGVLLGTRAFVDAISRHLRPDAASQARVPLIISRLRLLAGL